MASILLLAIEPNSPGMDLTTLRFTIQVLARDAERESGKNDEYINEQKPYQQFTQLRIRLVRT